MKAPPAHTQMLYDSTPVSMADAKVTQQGNNHAVCDGVLSGEFIRLADMGKGHLAAWQHFDDHHATDNIFYKKWYLQPSLQLFDPDGNVELFLCWKHDDSQKNGPRILVGILPLSTVRRYGRWPFPHITNWMHPNIFIGNPNIIAGFEDGFWVQLFSALDTKYGTGPFLHLHSQVQDFASASALNRVAKVSGRYNDAVQTFVRAMLKTDMDGDAYYRSTVRSKKRKELRRLRNRLSDEGIVAIVRGCADQDVGQWIDSFLSLEQSGWKGEAGSALASHEDSRALFTQVIKAAYERDAVDFASMTLNGRPIAMLATLINGDYGYSFKTCFDEDYARYSPGVLLQVELMGMHQQYGLKLIDSCAAQNHPMIDSLWGQRRNIVRRSVSLNGIIGYGITMAQRIAERSLDAVRARLRG